MTRTSVLEIRVEGVESKPALVPADALTPGAEAAGGTIRVRRANPRIPS